MNLWFKRKSLLNFEETIKNAKEQIKKYGFDLIGEKIEKDYALFTLYDKNFIQQTLALDEKSLIFLPFLLFIGQKNNETFVNIFNPEIIDNILHQILHQKNENYSNFTTNLKHEHKLIEITERIKNLISQITQNDQRKIKKIKLYATTTCPYCKMEEVWLKENNLNFEKVLVDLNQKEGELMVKKTGQLGVPVTEIVFEDDDEEYIIGFDKTQLTKILLSENKN